jgi:hypothetical protein
MYEREKKQTRPETSQRDQEVNFQIGGQYVVAPAQKFEPMLKMASVRTLVRIWWSNSPFSGVVQILKLKRIFF